MDNSTYVKRKNLPRIVYVVFFPALSYLCYLAWNTESLLIFCCYVLIVIILALFCLFHALFYKDEIIINNAPDNKTNLSGAEEVDYLENQSREFVLKWLRDNGGELRTSAEDGESEVKESEDSSDPITDFQKWVSDPENEKLQFDPEFYKFNNELEILLREERYDDAIEYCREFRYDWYKHKGIYESAFHKIWYEPNQKIDSIIEQIKQQRAPKSSRHISQDVKDSVWRRDKGICTQCGSNRNLEFDHIIPHSKGGANTYRNIQLLCQDCNRTKSDKLG